MERKKYFENLDGLRFIAFLMIFIAHALSSSNPEVLRSNVYGVISFLKGPCWLGVPFFFVLSGFLISYLLIIEKEKYQTINVGNFYMRRILRIWPLYFLLMVWGFIIFPIAQDLLHVTPVAEQITPWKYWTFLSNFDQIENGLPHPPGLVVAWSLAVEEQFYLFWPVLMLLTPSKYYFKLMVSLIVLSLVFGLTITAHEKHTLNCILDLAMGGLLAVTYVRAGENFNRLSRLPKATILFVYVAGAAMLYLYMYIGNSLRIFVSMFMAFVIFDQCFAENSFFKMSRYTRISKWGTYTYGLYILHAVALFVASNIIEQLQLNTSSPFMSDLIIRPISAFFLALILARIAYYSIEAPFLRIKKRFAS